MPNAFFFKISANNLQKRDVLNRTKQARDSLRLDNQRLHQQCGMLGNDALLYDYEERKEEAKELTEKLKTLKKDHAALLLNCNKYRRKIDGATELGEAP